MYNDTYHEKIRERITTSKRGTIFVISDFADISPTPTIKKVLSRLVQDKTIRRIMRGIYEYPVYNAFLDEYVAPSPHEIAKALARNFGWTIVPYEDAALNMLGISTQVPASWTYASDGPYKKYAYGNVTIQFKHTSNKDITNLSAKSALIIQALKAIGKDKVDEKLIKKFSDILTPDEKESLLEDTKRSSAWISGTIRQICA
ncbi:MAG: DUF6088 family protein [Methanocorpusculum sp.]|uniref:DUF6088 family protein n=1 Tax=Methanocorpusculum sp. TaxID=2058474 RepID=UPI002B1EC446|nr:DUF6088 family protein [Methanocorpusculum sp.]MEA5086957.1 DUF6088 family protein [Methanocorpusculum sp.]